MMRKMLLTGIVASVMFTISSCDEDTASIGKTLTSNVDLFTIVSDTFDVSSKSLVVDAVLSNSTYGYLGRIKDPETSAYITSDYMTQFATLENAIDSIFYPKENVMSMKDDKEVADSCYISIMLKGFTGDSLASMKMTISELDRPIDDTKKYYTNFDPEAEGYIRTDGLKYNVMYSVTDMMDSDSVRNAEKGSYYINIKLDKPYKAKNGKTFSVVRMGKQDMDEIFESEHSQNHLFLWVLRILGVILVITGLKGIFDILSTVLKVVPFVANIVGWGVGVVCTVVGIVWSLIIIAIAWLFYRPLIGIILLAIAAFLIWVFAFKGKDKLKELAKRKDMQPEIQKI